MKNKKSSEKHEKIMYPKIDLERAIYICNIVHGDYGDIVNREQLAKICKVKPNFGGFQNIVNALKNSYGFLEKASQSEYKLTELAQQALSGDMHYLMKALMRIEPFRVLIEMYSKDNLPKKAIIKDVVKDKFRISDKDSRAIANKFTKNMDYISKSSSSESIPDSTTKETYFHPSKIRDYDITSAIKVSWAISYLKECNDLNKENVLTILDNMLGESDKFEELKKEIEFAKKLSNYSKDEEGVIKYIKENFEKAFAKDFNIERISDLVVNLHPQGFSKFIQPKKKDKGESAEGDLTENQD